MKYTKLEVKNLINKYVESGKSLLEFDRTNKTDLTYQCKKYGLIKPNTDFRIENRKNPLSFDFKDITNEFESYILGFVYADGWISNKSFGIKIHIQDKDLLEKIKDYISPNSNLIIEKNSIKLNIHSDLLVNNLKKLGVEYNKSYKELSIPNIDKSLVSSFIRGYFDGDGTVFMDRKYIKTNIASTSESFLKEIQKILDKEEIKSNIYKESRIGKIYKAPQGESMCNKDIFRLVPSKKENVLKFKDYIYSKNVICLKRKLLKFEEYVNTEVNNQIAKG